MIQILKEFTHAAKIRTAFNLRKDIKCKLVDLICGVVIKGTIIVMKALPSPHVKPCSDWLVCEVQGPPPVNCD